MTDRCAPPAEHADERWHWLQIHDNAVVRFWWPGDGWHQPLGNIGSNDMARAGYRYLRPCRPDDAEARERLEQENKRLLALINTPVITDWFDGVRIEAAHQQERWGSSHDAGKSTLDWFWLIGYLAQKIVSADTPEKALHHTTSTAAALFNWYQAISGTNNRMLPGIEPPEQDNAR